MKSSSAAFLAGAFLLPSSFLSAANTPWSTTGNIGIGTTIPSAALEIAVPTGVGGLQISRPSSPTWQLMNYGPFYIQEGGVGPRLVVAPGGNVGIGTAAPYSVANYTSLDVRGTSGAIVDLGLSAQRLGIIYSWSGATVMGSVNSAPLILQTGDTERLRIDALGNVGVGTNTPYSVANYTSIDVRGTNGGTVDLGTTTQRMGVLYSWSGGTTMGSVNSAPLVLQTGDSERLRIDAAGNVGIGTSTPTYPLSVNGTVHAKEVIVDTSWSDYVFADNYRLASLSEVESQIKKEKHLSGIPSAKEVSEKGISIGQMEAKLLAKIEELTLHQIEQEKHQALQDQRIAEQASQIAQLKQQNASLQR